MDHSRWFPGCLKLIVPCLCLALCATSIVAQDKPEARAKKKQPPFRWVNPPKQLPERVQHSTFESPSMGVQVGYCVYLPVEYEVHSEQRFPVVYYLHGGRPGSESKSVKLAKWIHQYMQDDDIGPMIYVFVNGGPVSHYNMPDRPEAQGADVFIKELIPHVDRTYRTIASRNGRAIEGFSQGGRGTTRLMFRYPELFCSAAPGGAGHETEKRISEEGGKESDKLIFAKGDNTYDLARQYANRIAKSQAAELSIMVHVGTKGFNYRNNLAYMEFLDTLRIPYEKLIVEGASHSAHQIYERQGKRLLQFHARNFDR